MDIQEKMNQALNNFVTLVYELSEDFDKYLDTETESKEWRRNYIRIVVALIEGYSNCFREMAALGLELEHPALSKKEEKSLRTGLGFSLSDQIKYTLRATHVMFEISPIPDFSGKEWEDVVKLFDKRHSLMHPKRPADLEITDKAWPSFRVSALWLINSHLNVTRFLQKSVQQAR